ncbi:MAG: hypothetical protein PHI63_00195 [Patescibacteria group bacterium]|nr:hypothetical protein [Patescibacteria group bacterium]
MGFNLNEFADVAAQNPFVLIGWFLAHGGWVFLLPWAVWVATVMWLEWRRGIYDSQREFVVLAVDIPRTNEQTPRAIEQLFSHFSGMHNDPQKEDKWIAGEMEESIGLEIVSFGGYIQFLIHLNVKFRDLVEGAIYAQYPEAEIAEVEDYAMRFKGIKFPNDQFDVWGGELRMTNKQYYPIKTYREFEDMVSGEFKDPMASILEIFSKMTPDEQAWYQIVITPANNNWGEPGMELVYKLIGAKVSKKKKIWESLIDAPLNIISMFGDIISGTWGVAAQEQPATLIPMSQMLHLPPGKRTVVEAVERKISKIGFHTRIRLVYIARKHAFNKATRSSALFGAIKQFNTLDMNGFKPNKKKFTKVYGLFKKPRINIRKNKVMRWYRMRARQYEPGYYGPILNIEELAGLWHFPLMTVKVPTLQRTEAKRAEPPVTLPIAPYREGEPPVDQLV